MRGGALGGRGPWRGIGRREWLAGVALAWLGASGRAKPPSREPEGEDPSLREIEARARELGLRTFRKMRSRNYLAVGDATEEFQRLTLRDCELIAGDYLDYYRANGFDITPPSRRLILVTLADERSYKAMVGESLAEATGGLYNRRSNALFVYDYRRAPQKSLRAGHANLVFLAHEATHQLSFNTGLLNPRGDTPLCIIEGIGLYGEVRKFSARTEPGQVNSTRVVDLAHKQRRHGWLSVAQLLADDHPLRAEDLDLRHLAYAESWLLVYHLMKDPARLPGFRTYLAAIRNRRDASSRLDDARAHWGDLDRLDQELRRASIRLLRGLTS
ncbi:MAG: DUF1570 domain-containing protein [Singulisphaera sp.]|nr:DUF1570 domain-containing protein [Singulisphaera sp.]